MAPTLFPRDATPANVTTYKICLIIACSLFALTFLLLMRTYYKYRIAVMGWDRMTAFAHRIRNIVAEREQEIRDLEMAVQHVFTVASDEEWAEHGVSRAAADEQIRRTNMAFEMGRPSLTVELGRPVRQEDLVPEEGRPSMTVEVGQPVKG